VDRWTYDVLTSGWVGVDLFFVLSGFLITGILYDTKHGSAYLRRFYARRVLRIFPLYYASLVLMLGVLPLVPAFGTALAGVGADGEWYWLYLVNVRIAFEGWPKPALLGHFWSLAVEEQFYLVWPFVVLAFGRRALVRLCAAVMLGSLLLRVLLHAGDLATAAYVLTPARMDALAAGALVALIARGPGGLAAVAPASRIVGWACAAGVLGLVAFLGGLPAEHLVVGTVGYSLLALLAGALLVSVVRAPAGSRLAAAFTAAPLTFLGRYSYALYVLHHPLILLRPEGWSIDTLAQHVGGWLPAAGLYALAFILLCIPPALVSWHLIEKHFLRLKSRVAYDRRPGSAASLDSAG
jgi:peptidoglycan/LPS O-acetylase OafA/YrhL